MKHYIISQIWWDVGAIQTQLQDGKSFILFGYISIVTSWEKKLKVPLAASFVTTLKFLLSIQIAEQLHNTEMYWSKSLSFWASTGRNRI